MNKSNLIPVLKSFSKDEIKEFEKFLNSPFFGCAKFVLKFYKVLIKYYPVFNEDDIKKEKIFGIVYKDKKYNDALTRRIISDLIRYSEEYMTYKNFKKNDIYRSSCSLNELRIRNLGNLFRLRSETLMKKIDNSETVDPFLILESYFINVEMCQHRRFIRDEMMHESARMANEDFIVFFLKVFTVNSHRIFSFHNEIKSTAVLNNAFRERFDYEGFMDDIEDYESKYSPYLKMIRYCHNINIDYEDRISCSKLNSLISNNPGYFTNFELFEIYINLVTFYNYQNIKYDNIYLNEIFTIYSDILKKKLFHITNNPLQLSFCRKYISLCLLKGETESIKKFREDYFADFPELYKQDLSDYCDSVYFFEKKSFERSLTAAMKINIEKELFKKDIKILKIKNFYELDYLDSVYSEIDNLKHYLTDSETIIPDNLRKSRNFIKYISSVMRGKENKSGADLFVLKKELKKERLVIEKKWLLEKIDELSNR